MILWLLFLVTALLLGLSATVGLDGFLVIHAPWLRILAATGSGYSVLLMIRSIVNWRRRLYGKGRREAFENISDDDVRKGKRSRWFLLSVSGGMLLLAAVPSSATLTVATSGRIACGFLALLWGALGVLMGKDLREMRLQLEEGEGLRGSAEILGVKKTGRHDESSTGVVLLLRVSLSGRDDYQLYHKTFVPHLGSGRVIIGGRLAVRVDERHDDNIAIDWLHPAPDLSS